MPFGDRTGPAGSGPRTGRGAGYCAGNAVGGNMNPAGRVAGWGGRGGGMGRGGRGWRNCFCATGVTGWQRAAVLPAGFAPPAPAEAPVPGAELDALKGQASSFESALAGIRRRIDALEAKSKPE